MTDIQCRLFEMRDEQYKAFNSSLIPTVAPETVIGVRTPQLRAFAKELYKSEEKREFMKELPHEYFEENNLHAFLIEQIKDFDCCAAELERFLPWVDNWATCDCMHPKVFKKHKAELLKLIRRWINAEHCYTVRFGLEMLMCHFLDEDFKEEYLEWAVISSEEYYIKMMVAWFFATALAKQYEATIGFIESGRLDKWTHNKAIQKACESYRVNTEHKTYLKTLKK